MVKITGKKIKSLRQKLGLTQIQFAAKIGVSKVSIINWETGRRKPMPMAYNRLIELMSETK